MIFFTIQQIKPSWSELFVVAISDVLSGLHVVDIVAMRLGDYGSCPLMIKTMVGCVHKVVHSMRPHQVTQICFDNNISSHTVLKSSLLNSAAGADCPNTAGDLSRSVQR
ncbi:unnamed protein product [Hymenolepis diminuta]|uniref:Uncharacterized protein n=1 Tax=Hymenolepis diminuta TaxID=6216 RepID=A0A564Z6P3_HYMDI|nr:unnamed protein product [Hymenolepis diminuta]